MTVSAVSVSHAPPHWEVLGEREHLIVERQFKHGSNIEAIATACGTIGTPSTRDRRGKAPRCPVCGHLADDAPPDAYLAARTS